MESKLCLLGKVVAVLAIMGLVAACGPGYIEGGYGRVYLELNADGPKCDNGNCSGIADGVLEAWANIDEVSVHMARGGGWVVISETPVKVDLLRLPDHAADLGFAQIPSGKVTQIRLHVAEGSQSYVVEEGGSVVPMTIPSGMKSGIKIVGKFNVGPCTENVVSLTISDHHSAIHVHPDGQLTRYIFRPVIKLGEVITEEGECDPDDNPGNGGGGDDGDDGDDDGDDQECIPGDDAFPCPGGSTGNDGSGDDGSGDDGSGDDGSGDGSGDGSDVGTGDGTDVGAGDGTGDGAGTGDGTGDDGTGDGTGDDGTGDGTGDGTCDPAVDDTCRP